jgi:hypothetical protein
MAGIGVNFFLSKSPSAGKTLPLDFGNLNIVFYLAIFTMKAIR